MSETRKVKVTRRRFKLSVVVEVLTTEQGRDLSVIIGDIKERIESQVAGHRTERRLADVCEVSFDQNISTSSFFVEVGPAK